MKVVINCSFGGFDISDQLFEKILTRKKIAFVRVEHSLTYITKNAYYFREGHVDDEFYRLSSYDLFKDDRTDADLIAVIEEMGETERKSCSLSIVDIPDDVKWHIHEYDGKEHVAENHRTWYG